MKCDVLRQVSARLNEGCRVLRVAGAAGGAKAFAVAHAILTENRPAAVLAISNVEAQNLSEEIKFYLDLLSPAPPGVFHLPSLEVDPYRGLSPHPEIAAARAQALWQSLQDGVRVIVASARAAAVRLHSPQRFLSHCLELKQEDEYPPEEARRFLLELGYVEDDPVTDPGEFSLRGGILDVFPPHLEHPVRLEFYGDRIESLRFFNIDSQRSIDTLHSAQIIPMREHCYSAAAFQRWAEAVPGLWSPPFLPHLEEELARAHQGEPFPAFEFLMPATEPLENTFFDYIRGYRLIVSDREVLEANLGRQHEELYERYMDRFEAHKPVLQPQQIYISTDQLSAAMELFPRLEVDEISIDRP
ncbi:MAG TPA: hypothetical protein VE398_24555, partial [Acidobacteriota bacterium]|nr:hypothetical protein [Acidobacteriota bacterium]